jgi:hypothetical protein
MHTHETLARINAEWPNPLGHQERNILIREAAILQLEDRLGVAIDRADPMLGAMASCELAMMGRFGMGQPFIACATTKVA